MREDVPSRKDRERFHGSSSSLRNIFQSRFGLKNFGYGASREVKDPYIPIRLRSTHQVQPEGRQLEDSPGPARRAANLAKVLQVYNLLKK